MSASSLTCSNLQDDAHDIGHEEDQSRDHDHDHDDHQQDRHGDHDHREHRDHQDHREHQHLKRHPAISMSAIDSSEHDSHHHARSLNLAAHHVKSYSHPHYDQYDNMGHPMRICSPGTYKAITFRIELEYSKEYMAVSIRGLPSHCIGS
eukprot:3526684-Pyramimonas_sp.AAC.1